ncbi:hypothetical protein BaRGS_00008412 [Batillaria attramentaria]|uniref:Uncharacterized protein n=1 Tax=Batillaria attramentaria TaxID=370345 RepID=A0ABD0LMI2_9CAEN
MTPRTRHVRNEQCTRYTVANITCLFKELNDAEAVWIAPLNHIWVLLGSALKQQENKNLRGDESFFIAQCCLRQHRRPYCSIGVNGMKKTFQN